MLTACDSDSTSTNSEVNIPSDDLYVDPSDLIEGLSPQDQVPNNRERLNELLSNPIDLASYKAEYGKSNSGNANPEEVYFQPDTIGFYYQFMLFYKLRKMLESHPSESDLFRDFRLITYKYGDNPGYFNDTNEELIAIECAMKNETLGELDFVGMGKVEFEEKYGVPDRINIMQAVYVFNQTVLSLHYVSTKDIPGDRIKVDWFKLVQVNDKFVLDEALPVYLTEYN